MSQKKPILSRIPLNAPVTITGATLYSILAKKLTRTGLKKTVKEEEPSSGSPALRKMSFLNALSRIKSATERGESLGYVDHVPGKGYFARSKSGKSYGKFKTREAAESRLRKAKIMKSVRQEGLPKSAFWGALYRGAAGLGRIGAKAGKTVGKGALGYGKAMFSANPLKSVPAWGAIGAAGGFMAPTITGMKTKPVQQGGGMRLASILERLQKQGETQPTFTAHTHAQPEPSDVKKKSFSESSTKSASRGNPEAGTMSTLLMRGSKSSASS